MRKATLHGPEGADIAEAFSIPSEVARVVLREECPLCGAAIDCELLEHLQNDECE